MAKPSSLWFRKQTGFWMTTVHGVQHKLSKDKGEARKMLNRLLAEERPKPVRTGLTLRKLCDNYLVRTKERKEERSHEVQVLHLNAVCSKLGHRDPASLKVYEVEEWLDAQESWSKSTRALFITIIKAVFNWADDQGYVTPNPIKKLKRRSTGRRRRVLSEEERGRIMAAVSQDFRDFLELLQMTGCRPFSEGARITAADVDFDRGRAVLAKHKTAKKTDRPRLVYLPPGLLEKVRERAGRYPTGPLYRNRLGNGWSADTVGKYVKRVCLKLKIEGVTSYTIRHSFISAALVKGVPVEVLAVLAGNTPAMIHKHYDQCDKMDEALREAAKKANQ